MRPPGVRRGAVRRLALRRPRSSHPVANLVALLLVTFLVLFPKGGIKLGGLPVTWGYLLLGALVPVLAVVWLVKERLAVAPAGLLAVLTVLPFDTIVLYTAAVNGVADKGFFVAMLLHFLVLPPVFLLLLPVFSDRVDTRRFTAMLCGAIFWAAVWGILLFFLWPLTHHLVEIPLLTVNLGDYGQVAETKHIARGAFLKLISTYNNGNVYGVATFLLLPLFVVLEPRRHRHWVVRAALLLTLSRTVWAGLLAEQLLSLLPPLLATAQSFPVLRLRGTGRQLLLVGGTLVLVLVVLFSSSYGLSFLLDPTLGGRAGEILSVTSATLLPSGPVYGFSEVLFASALTTFGYVGAGSLMLIFAYPVLFWGARQEILGDPVRRAALKGLVLYVILSLSDGAANLIPVMAFYWFVESVLLYGLPGRRGLYADAPQTVPTSRPRGGLVPAPAQV